MQKKIWHKVAEEISLQVSLGKWPVGSIIPGEIELAKQFNVSRDTMRKALAYLSQQGLFERKAHVGTRVKARTRTGRFLNEYNDIRGIDHYGNLYPRYIQNVERLVLNEETADRLGLIPGEEVIRFKNIRVASERHPEAVVVTYVYIYPNALEVLDLIKKRSDDLIITLAEEVTGQECVEVKQAFQRQRCPKKSRIFSMFRRTARRLESFETITTREASQSSLRNLSTWLKDFLSRFEASNVPKRKGGRSLLPNPICYSN